MKMFRKAQIFIFLILLTVCSQGFSFDRLTYSFKNGEYVELNVLERWSEINADPDEYYDAKFIHEDTTRTAMFFLWQMDDADKEDREDALASICEEYYDLKKIKNDFLLSEDQFSFCQFEVVNEGKTTCTVNVIVASIGNYLTAFCVENSENNQAVLKSDWNEWFKALSFWSHSQ